jgi:probable rRNA maturation factor
VDTDTVAQAREHPVMSIEVLEESGSDADAKRLAQVSRFVLERLRVHPQAELCIKLVDEQTIAELNEQWMDKTGPTDVLAFPMDELRPGLVNEEPEEGILGDLMVCPAVAERQADEARATGQAGYTADDELDLLTVHGILHLLGYDHAEADEKAEMFGLQDTLLAEWRAVRLEAGPQ